MRCLPILLAWASAICAIFTSLSVSSQALAFELDPQLTNQTPPVQFEEGPAPSNPNPSPVSEPASGFWQEGRRLLQQQITLTDRLDDAFSGPNPNAVRAVDGQVLLHVSAVERFGRNYYGNLPPSCSGSAGVTATDPTAKFYCSLLTNARDLEKLRPRLYERLEMLASIAEVKDLPLVSGERSVGPGGVPRMEKGSLNQPARPLYARAPYLPPQDQGVLGRPLKSPLGDYRAPLPPAIQPPAGVPENLEEIRSRLDEATLFFPRQASTRQLGASAARAGSAPGDFVRPRELKQWADRNAYEVPSSERQLHQKQLANPHTGLTRVLASNLYNPDPNQLRNRLDPTIEERYPYAILVQPQDPPLPRLPEGVRGRLAPFDTQRAPFVPLEQTAFRPRLALQMDGQQIKNIMRSGLDYGFMYDVGKTTVDINKISAGLAPDQLPLRKDLREMFLNYRPPTNLEGLMAERRRFLSGKTGPNNQASILSPKAPIQLGHTYVLRSFQFQVPDAIAKGEPVSYAQRKNLDKVLDMPGSDVLVVFRPVAKKADGSYTILWRVLGEFTPPKVTDLAQHVSFK